MTHYRRARRCNAWDGAVRVFVITVAHVGARNADIGSEMRSWPIGAG
ncbi:MAG: hypothetical protein WB526_01115 [Candidatus Cybelea sp.]